MKCMEVTLFHGSGSMVEFPEIRITEYTKDFGFGFYCTNLYTQAERWAFRHTDSAKGEVPTVNFYRYAENPKLKIKRFREMTNEWLDFIALCRSSSERTPHDYDIVAGPMADDQVWNYVDDFLDGNITRQQFWAMARYKNPTHQITFHTEAALECLKFERKIDLHAEI